MTTADQPGLRPCEDELEEYLVVQQDYLDAKRDGDARRAALIKVDFSEAAKAYEDCKEAHRDD